MLNILLTFIIVQGTINVDSLLSVAREYHDKALSGEKGALEKAEMCFKKILKLEPDNAIAYIWYGSLLTIKGRDAKFPFQKLKYVNEGLKLMDKAVKMDSSNIEIRWVRAQNNLSLPYFFGRLDTALMDLEFIEKHSKKDHYNALFWLGKGYEQKGDIEKARECWQKVIEESPDTVLTLKAKKCMKETEE